MTETPAGAGYPSYPQPPRDHPQAVLILILGIVSLVLCILTGPFAWFMGRRALTDIDRSGGAIGGRSMVMAGYICGIISSAFIILAVVGAIIVLIVGVIADTTS
ncbi:DUF4190 domain-containing protein [Nocardia sp. NPDC049526]|uniref:DUF4190 domain-containing protein n=1 Tax=Nocardia sp. NPDC049526 TaxID=3364316 RepID=UPI0037B5786D